MATISDVLKGINAYPIPTATLEAISVVRGLTLNAPFTKAIAESNAFKLAKADVYAYLAKAPNVSQGGQSYSFDEATRKKLSAMADAIYDEVGDPEAKVAAVSYGYKGKSL